MQESHVAFCLGGFKRKAVNLCPAAVIPLQCSRQHLRVCNVCMQLPSAVINNAFDAQPSEELTKEASYKEKSILWSSQEQSGEEIGRLAIFMSCLIYVEGVHVSESF